MILTMNLDLENNDYFLCSWNGTEITQIHTKESLIEEYKETGLFEVNDWVFPPKWDIVYGTVIELMDYLIEGGWLFREYHNDNMMIMYIKTKNSTDHDRNI